MLQPPAEAEPLVPGVSPTELAPTCTPCPWLTERLPWEVVEPQVELVLAAEELEEVLMLPHRLDSNPLGVEGFVFHESVVLILTKSCQFLQF